MCWPSQEESCVYIPKYEHHLLLPTRVNEFWLLNKTKIASLETLKLQLLLVLIINICGKMLYTATVIKLFLQQAYCNVIFPTHFENVAKHHDNRLKWCSLFKWHEVHIFFFSPAFMMQEVAHDTWRTAESRIKVKCDICPRLCTAATCQIKLKPMEAHTIWHLRHV